LASIKTSGSTVFVCIRCYMLLVVDVNFMVVNWCNRVDHTG